VVDAQSGHEKTITGMLPALAGANVIYGLGMLEMGITFDLAQLVLDHEFAGMILHSLDGIVVNDETLSVDVIRELGIGKDYMAHASTYKHMKSQSQAQIIDRRMREDWETAGGTDAYKRAHNRMIEMLETYEPAPLPENVVKTLRSIVEEAEKELVR
jgi:trimethylamine--corrinoid protein Co-methyltransferase